jgi:hypothetical protein
MIAVELIKMLIRPRTWLIIGMLVALPTLVAVLLAVTELGPRPGTGPPFLSAVLSDGTLFPLAALGVVLPLFLPIAVAVLGGDAIAGESQTGTLRYLLVRPVGRTSLLLAKLVTVVAFVLPRGPAAARCGTSNRNSQPERVHPHSARARLAHRPRIGVRGDLHARRCGCCLVPLHRHDLVDRRRAGHDWRAHCVDRVARAGCCLRLASIPTDALLAGVRRLVP